MLIHWFLVMECSHCGQLLNPDSRFCNACGIEVRKELLARSVYRNADTNLLLSYIGWLVLINISFVFLPRYLLQDLVLEERTKAYITMANINLIVSIVDIALMIVVIGLSKARIIKVIFVVYLVCKLLLFLPDIKI